MPLLQEIPMLVFKQELLSLIKQAALDAIFTKKGKGVSLQWAIIIMFTSCGHLLQLYLLLLRTLVTY